MAMSERGLGANCELPGTTASSYLGTPQRPPPGGGFSLAAPPTSGISSSSPRTGSAPPSVEELAGFRSKFVDVSRIPPQHLGHIQKLLCSRHTVRQRETRTGPAAPAAVGAASTEDDLERAAVTTGEMESYMRKGLAKAELNERETLLADEAKSKAIASGEKDRQRIERRRRREIKRLEELKQQELRRAYITAFRSSGLSKQQRADAEDGAPERTAPPQDEKSSAINVCTKRLRQLYKDSAPPFAADPTELWERGVVLPPDRQMSPQRKALAVGLPNAEQLPKESYHEFATRLRRLYWQRKIDHDARNREEAFLAAQRPAAAAAHNHQPGFLATPGRADYDFTVRRLKHEVRFGPAAEWTPAPGPEERAAWR
eukprot:Hpha_TRINITY_DN2896_c0_g1::TRINITY_DN2896_c0_g1_i1::g.171502::m.171502